MICDICHRVMDIIEVIYENKVFNITWKCHKCKCIKKSKEYNKKK